MKAFSNSILLKLWFFTVTLVLLVIYITGVVQTRQLKELFYDQQLSDMTIEAKNIAMLIELAGAGPSCLLNTAEALNANIMITDKDGYIIHCLGMGMHMVDVGEEKICVIAHHDIPLKSSDIQTVLQGQPVYYRGPYFFLDTDVITVVAPTYKHNEIDGMIILSAPLAQVEEKVAGLQKVTIYAGLAGIIVATLLCLLFSRSITRPLLRMNKAAQDMAGGNYSRQVEVNSRDEIGMLANSLNTLATDLHAKITTLERLDKTRRDYVINVAHELRTPLSIIQGFSEALIDGMAGSESDRQKYLENIHEESLRLSKLVADILDLQKIEAGVVEMHAREIDLAEIAERAIGKFKPMTNEKGVILAACFDPQKPVVIQADQDRIEQVLMNLLDNALRATPAGGKVELSITTIGNEIQVSIKDSGSGIPPGEQELIWERFYKLDKSRSRSNSGTGLGLAIVKDIVVAHGGSVQVDSKPGSGSIFTLILPVKR